MNTAVTSPPPNAPSFSVIAKPTGAACNLRCEYCFFLEKQSLYPGSDFRMSEELQGTYLRQLFDSHAESPEILVAWQGGEPTLMGLDFFRRSIELEHKYARPGQRVVNTLQTNGILLDDEWAAFLKENDFLVGLSIDGPRCMHDAYRKDKRGKPVFDRVMEIASRLNAHGVDWNALTTVNNANGDAGAEVYRFLRDECEAGFVQFIPIVEKSGTDRDATAVTERSIQPRQYGRFMIEVFEEWVRHDVGRVYVQSFDSALAAFVGVPGSVCVHAETCGEQVVVEHNGDLYSCDHFVEPGHLLGNIGETHMTELVSSKTQRRFGQDKREGLTHACRECEVLFACNGGCPKDRFAISPRGELGHQYLCEGYEAFFRHVSRSMSAMAQLLAAGRAPAEIMRLYAAEDARRGRVDRPAREEDL